jgi:hypothetical protein
MPSLSKSFKFVVNTGVGSTATSVAVGYPLYPFGITGTQDFTSMKEQGAGYYGTTNGLHTLVLATTPSFRGTATIQATLAVDPQDTDWFDVNSAEFTYTSSSTGYIPGLLIGANPTGSSPGPRNDYATFSGQFTWLRTHLAIDEGAVLSIKYNY